MPSELLIAGAGIAGLSFAIALANKNNQSSMPLILEQSTRLQEVGAGIQLGPNATRRLNHWGLKNALADVAFFPQALIAMNGKTGNQIATLPLGQTFQNKYGAPYLSILRADLQTILLEKSKELGVEIQLGKQLQAITPNNNQITITATDGSCFDSTLLVGADGLWSRVRQCIWQDGLPVYTGHVAYRTLVPMLELPKPLRFQTTHVWMGEKFHVVHYPVHGGSLMNIVALIEHDASIADSQSLNNLQTWDHQANTKMLFHALKFSAHKNLLNLLNHSSNWQLWPLCGRPSMQGGAEHFKPNIALIGDAAHPMLPYLAQGASMAIEDASALGECLTAKHNTPISQQNINENLSQFANLRWRRNALVQKRAQKNGEIFHATGLRCIARNIALRMFGAHLMEQSWLYDH